MFSYIVNNVMKLLMKEYLSDVQAEDVQAEDVQAEDVQAEDVQAEDVQAEDEVQAEEEVINQQPEIKPLKRFSWTLDYHRIFLLTIIKGRVGIDVDFHPIFTESWTDFTQDFLDYMIEFDLYSPEMQMLFERPHGDYINGQQILQSHYSDIKKNTASAKQKIQARETHDVMMYMNKYHE